MIVIYYALRLYEIILLIRIVMSWIQPNPYHPFVRFIYKLTEPLLGTIRRILPITGFGFDFSPIVVFIILEFLQRLFLPYAYLGF